MRIFIFLSGLLFLVSCNNPTESEPQTKGFEFPVPPISLANKFFITSAGMDSACQFKEQPTDFYQELVFVNDSEFVRTVHSCCGEFGEDFTNATYTGGIYKVDEKELTLNFTGVYVENIEHSLIRPGEIEPQTTTRLEEKVVNLPTLKFKRFNCGAAMYFRQTGGEPFADGFVSPKDSAASYIKSLKKEGVWEMLFSLK